MWRKSGRRPGPIPIPPTFSAVYRTPLVEAQGRLGGSHQQHRCLPGWESCGRRRTASSSDRTSTRRPGRRQPHHLPHEGIGSDRAAHNDDAGKGAVFAPDGNHLPVNQPVVNPDQSPFLAHLRGFRLRNRGSLGTCVGRYLNVSSPLPRRLRRHPLPSPDRRSGEGRGGGWGWGEVTAEGLLPSAVSVASAIPAAPGNGAENIGATLSDVPGTSADVPGTSESAGHVSCPMVVLLTAQEPGNREPLPYPRRVCGGDIVSGKRKLSSGRERARHVLHRETPRIQRS